MKLTDILGAGVGKFLSRNADKEALQRRIRELNKPRSENPFYSPNRCTKCGDELTKVKKRYGKHCCSHCGYPVSRELENKIERAIQSRRELPPPRSKPQTVGARPEEYQPTEHYTQLPYWVRDEREGSPTYGELIQNPQYEDTQSGILKPAFKQGSRMSDDYFVK
jgi:ribosomal protein L37E